MTWTKTKIFFEKSFAWCVQHWRWLIFGLVALIAYLTGRKNARNLWKQAELAKKQYKREASEIERTHAEKEKKLQNAEERYQKSLKVLDKKYNDENSKLEKQKDKEYKKLLKQAKKDPDRLDSLLKDMGITEV